VKLAVRAAALAALVVLGAVARGADSSGKKLIEFGWDEPDTRFMREHIAELQASPFDGCVFHVLYRLHNGTQRNFSWDLWGRGRFADSLLDSARLDLQATRFGRFRENFLRVNVTPGDLDWFEDHSAVMANLEQAARLAKLGGCPGILFDTEAYRGPLWDFKAQSQAHPHTWEEISAQVRKRGAEAMTALERGYPGLTVLLTMAYSWPLDETTWGRHPLPEAQYGLLVPFLDGMVDAASDSVVLVDGHERSYPYRDPALFAAKADTMRHAVRRLVARPERYARLLSVGFGIWLDHNSPKLGWHPDHPDSNWFTPAALRISVQAALDHADRYVWIYSQEPRWWTPGGSRKDLPAAYDSVLRVVRR
jgi:hypothetical protein